MPAAESLYRLREEPGGIVVAAAERWTVAEAQRLDDALATLKVQRDRRIRFDFSGLTALDTSGAWLIHKTRRRLAERGAKVELVGLTESREALIERVAATDEQHLPQPEREFGLMQLIEHLGFMTAFVLRDFRTFVGFLGLTLTTLAVDLVRPWHLRWTAFVYHLEAVGLNALPIVGLISFLIGVVLAYQGSSQLRLFGAEIFVVDLVAISVLREIGILLTAIVVAGRSGSAFTAQIGSMKLREEVDAMRTIGLDPIRVLVLPRLLALTVALPLLCFFADLMGLFGGGLMAWLTLDLSPAIVIERIHDRVTFWTFWVGMIKAPVFAVIIALVGCYQGLRVRGAAESVGRLTTRSVVQSIFLVIVVDALFSIFFNVIGI
jgi:phospholipid/cholesterol/gamma-HCH transport system permease protein